MSLRERGKKDKHPDIDGVPQKDQKKTWMVHDTNEHNKVSQRAHPFHEGQRDEHRIKPPQTELKEKAHEGKGHDISHSKGPPDE